MHCRIYSQLTNWIIRLIREPTQHRTVIQTSGYATWFTAEGAIRIAHYDVIDDVVTRKL